MWRLTAGRLRKWRWQQEVGNLYSYFSPSITAGLSDPAHSPPFLASPPCSLMLSFTHSFPFLCVFSVSKEMCEAFFSCKLGYLTARSFTTVHSKGKKVVIDMLHDKVHDSTEQAGITFKLQVKGCLLCKHATKFFWFNHKRHKVYHLLHSFYVCGQPGPKIKRYCQSSFLDHNKIET